MFTITIFHQTRLYGCLMQRKYFYNKLVYLDDQFITNKKLKD